MVRARLLLAILGLLALTGCNGPAANGLKSAFQSVTPGSTSCSSTAVPDIFFAKPLCDTYGTWKDAADVDTHGTATDKADFVAAALKDSRDKCQVFISQFTGSQGLENSAFDITSLVLTGLAAVLTPVNTVRALAASSTAVQGTKQAINSDLYQQMTVILLVQEINNSYYQQLNVDFANFTASGQLPANFSAGVAFAKLVDDHKNCSIPFAAANAVSQGKITTGAGSTAPPSTTITISGTVLQGDQLTLTGKSTSANFSQSLPAYTVSASDITPVNDGAYNVAKALINLFQTKPSGLFLERFGVLIYPGANNIAGTGQAQIVLVGGPSDITWTLAPSPGTETINYSPPPKS